METKGGMEVNTNGCVWLPEVLIEDILLRLPATSLIPCRCVCKSWLSLISSNEFVRKHLNLNSQHFNSVALISHSQDWDGFSDSVISVSSSPQDEDQVTELKLPEAIEINNNGIRIWGHCDGLLLLVALKGMGIKIKIIAIWNPLMNKYKTLPLPKGFRGLDLENKNEALGMGYDPSIDDFKVVRVSTASRLHHKVDVLTLKSNKWRRFKYVLNDSVLKNRDDIVFPNGSFVCDNNGGFFCISHARYNYNECILLRFDLAEEKFQVVPMPPNPFFTAQDVVLLRPVFLGSMGMPATLCLEYIPRNEGDYEIWIAKHETGWTWIKLFTIPTILVKRGHRLLCYTQFGKVLFITKNDEFAIYDPQQNSIKKLAIHGLQQYANLSYHVFPYIHSLVCP